MEGTNHDIRMYTLFREGPVGSHLGQTPMIHSAQGESKIGEKNMQGELAYPIYQGIGSAPSRPVDPIVESLIRDAGHNGLN